MGNLCGRKCQNPTNSSPKLWDHLHKLSIPGPIRHYGLIWSSQFGPERKPSHCRSQSKPIGIITPHYNICSSFHCQQSFGRNQSRNSSASLLAALAVRNGHSGNRGCLEMFSLSGRLLYGDMLSKETHTKINLPTPHSGFIPVLSDRGQEGDAGDCPPFHLLWKKRAWFPAESKEPAPSECTTSYKCCPLKPRPCEKGCRSSVISWNKSCME